MARRRRRVWLWIVVGLAAAVGLMLLLDEKRRPTIPQVVAVPVARETLTTSVTSNGKAEPVEPYSIQARLASFIDTVSVVEGQTVRRGDLLLTLNLSEISEELAREREELASLEEELRTAGAGGSADELAQLEGDLSQADLNLARLQREREILQRLLAKEAATREELDRNRFEADRIEAERRVLLRKREELARRARFNAENASLKSARVRETIRTLEEKVRGAQVTAPADGVIYTLIARKGTYVRVGDLLAELADLRRMRVRAFVDEPDLGSLAVRQVVEIGWEAHPNKTWTGIVERIPPGVVSRGTRNVGEVFCTIDNMQQELLPNVSVTVRIRVQERVGALVVPRGAVRVDGNRRYVFVAQGGRLARREIQVGTADATRYEALSGLSEGDRVVLPGDVELREGLAVRVSGGP